MTKEETITIGRHNTKLGPAIPTIDMPRVITCNPNAPCAWSKEALALMGRGEEPPCYAGKGHYIFASVKEAKNKNYAIFQKDPDLYFRQVAVRTSLDRYARWNSCGDIPNVRYLYGMIWVAEQNPETTYLAFTKQFGIVNLVRSAHGAFPPNLVIVFSHWDKWFEVDNPFGFPETYVRFKAERLNPRLPEGAYECPGHCPTCLKCWALRGGETVIFNEH